MTSNQQLATSNERQYQIEVHRNFRWNFFWNALDGVFFSLGYSFVSSTTVLPVFVSHLTSSKVLIGLTTSLDSMGWLLPQLFTANYTERLARKKPFVVTISLISERIGYLLLALLALFVATRSPGLALIGFFLIWTWHNLGAGLVAPAWLDMIAKVIPSQWRGRFFGVSYSIGAALGLVGAYTSRVLLDRFGYPDGFAYCFLMAFVAVLISWVGLAQTREPPRLPRKQPVSNQEYLRRLPGVLQADVNFRNYLIGRILGILGEMSLGFLAVYAVQRFRLPDREAGGFTAALLIGQVIGYLAFGGLGDRWGHKRVLELVPLFMATAVGVAIRAPTMVWFYLVFLLVGAGRAGYIVSGFSLITQLSDEDNRPTYIGLTNTNLGISRGLAPIIGGGIAGAKGYPTLFITSLFISLAAFVVMHQWVREPREITGEYETAGGG
ncbi:MAG TPA: MFS transporter [Anaerolineae bacterium]|nr:MFS transporter [Anaerolineae bacterium]HIQ04612.1 MFS transporter [Anaerolineae bacterium]